MIPSKTPRQTIMLNANQIKVEETQKVVLLDRLTFKDHVDILCSNTNYKLHALGRIRKYLTLEEQSCYTTHL